MEDKPKAPRPISVTLEFDPSFKPESIEHAARQAIALMGPRPIAARMFYTSGPSGLDCVDLLEDLKQKRRRLDADRIAAIVRERILAGADCLEFQRGEGTLTLQDDGPGGTLKR